MNEPTISRTETVNCPDCGDPIDVTISTDDIDAFGRIRSGFVVQCGCGFRASVVHEPKPLPPPLPDKMFRELVKTCRDALPNPDLTMPKGKPIRNEKPHVGRNQPCPCGSGRKFKSCHMAR